jgi:hypothetical protein
MTDWPTLPAFERSPGLRAAQYVRMSTDHQRYSTLNQAETIAAYAARRGITIVGSYSDEGPRELLVRKARQLETASHISEWLTSTELKPPQ